MNHIGLLKELVARPTTILEIAHPRLIADSARRLRWPPEASWYGTTMQYGEDWRFVVGAQAPALHGPQDDTFVMMMIGLKLQLDADMRYGFRLHIVPPRQPCGVGIAHALDESSGLILLTCWRIPEEEGTLLLQKHRPQGPGAKDR